MEAALVGQGGERTHSRASAQCHLMRGPTLLQPGLMEKDSLAVNLGFFFRLYSLLHLNYSSELQRRKTFAF